MSINWQDLRPLNGSQHSAFEELCCQLAGAETTRLGSTFIRKGAPDAGVECYWKLPDQSEWGWQAKYFLSPPTNNQWTQIDESVKTSLTKHPQLSRYVVCLPIDRQDPRIDKQQWFMDKWNERVQTWEAWATSKGMAVVFEYWGAHEIFERLSREEHHGRYYFWFKRDLFSQEWFQNRIEEAIANVGPRYSPELDVQLPIARVFQGLGRTHDFCIRVKELRSEIKKALPPSNSFLPEGSQQLNDALDRLANLLNIGMQDPVERFDWDGIRDLTRAAMDIARDIAQALPGLVKSLSEASPSEERNDEIERLKYLDSRYWQLYRELSDLNEFAESDEARLANLPALLLVAEAGRGKTHLFCDVARHRIQAIMPTVLLIGGQFNNDEPWAQIIRLLGLSCTKDEFLGALEAVAQARRTRAIILIDALNEGQGKALWKKHLAGILLTLSKFPWLGIAISVRTSYEDTIVPNGLTSSRLIRVEHHGFAEHEYEATKTFFDYFGIQRPSIPLLVPEFQNPLFLKIFCQGLNNKQLISIPPGLQGITAVFRFFIDSVNQKLSDSEYLNFNPKLPFVWRAVTGLSARLAEQGKDWLPIEEAQDIIDRVLPREGYENSLFRHLLAEGVIAENRFYIGNNQWGEGIHFSYEKFTDHLVADYLLDKHLNTNDPADSFSPSNPLARYVTDQHACALHQGLIEAFAIQLPERVGKELIEIVPSIQEFYSVINAFIESIIWRHPQSLNVDIARNYINGYVIRDSYHHDRLLNALLTVAANPDHPMNANFLHRNLLRFEMAERDSWWSIFLHEQYGTHGSVDRLVDWAWSPEDKTHIRDEPIRLCGVALSWFLTTSNRFLRDRATKALVRLFTTRLNILRDVIQSFADVNDPYVFERLMAVAYGCALRSEDTENIGELATFIFTLVFVNGNPPVHILLRDYARGVIEVAIHRNVAKDIELDKIRPPYNSTFPEHITSEAELKAKYNNFDTVKHDVEYAQSEIWSSVMDYGDFARYVLGSDRESFEWSSRRLNEEPIPTYKEQYAAFVAVLTDRQKRLFDKYRQIRDNIAFYRKLDAARRQEYFDSQIEYSDEELDAVLEFAEEQLRKQLGKKKSVKLSENIIHYLDNPHEDELRFDISLLQRFVLQRVFELGWTVERFGQFDRYINYRDGREAHKPERIGKKYQWIAYHEFLARVADNFVFRGERWRDSKEDKYEGTWQLSVRDIDPSWLLSRTYGTSGWHSFAPTWWAPVDVNWANHPTDKEWIRDQADLPATEPLIDVVNQVDHSQWLTLEGSYWWETVRNSENESRYPKRNIHYFLQSYIVKQSDVEEVYQWMKTQWRATANFTLPDSHPLYNVFLGEYYWAPAYLYYNVPYHHHSGWVGGEPDDSIPKPILTTTDQYAHEASGFDCSVDEHIGIYVPCKWLVDEMGLRWQGIEGQYFDTVGNLIGFDPTVSSKGPGGFLIERKSFLKYLADNGYSIIWFVTGEKVVITGDAPSRDGWAGRLSILGVYYVQDGKVVGEMNTQVSE